LVFSNCYTDGVLAKVPVYSPCLGSTAFFFRFEAAGIGGAAAGRIDRILIGYVSGFSCRPFLPTHVFLLFLSRTFGPEWRTGAPRSDPFPLAPPPSQFLSANASVRVFHGGFSAPFDPLRSFPFVTLISPKRPDVFLTRVQTTVRT